MTSTRAPANVREVRAQVASQLGAGADVERGERLVEQQEPGLGHERACQRDALLLPARQRRRLRVGAVVAARRVRATRVARRRASARLVPRLRSPNATFSSTVRCGNSR